MVKDDLMWYKPMPLISNSLHEQRITGIINTPEVTILVAQQIISSSYFRNTLLKNSPDWFKKWVTPDLSLWQADVKNETLNWCKVIQIKCHYITKESYEYTYSQRCHPSHHINTSVVLHTLSIALILKSPTFCPKQILPPIMATI